MGTAVVVAVVVAALLIIRSSGEPAEEATTYRLETPAQAGGLTRDGEADPIEASTPAYRHIQAVLQGRGTGHVSALYRDDAGRIITLQAASGDLGDPADLLTRLQANPPQAGDSAVRLTTTWERLNETDPGPHGGKAACGEVSVSAEGFALPSITLIECAWQTERTFGTLLPIVSASEALTVDQVADLMRRMRNDLEQPEAE